MLRFRTFLKEQFILEYKEWHQYVKQNGARILDRMGHSEKYQEKSSEEGHGTPEHMTEYIKGSLGMGDMSQEHGRWILDKIHKGHVERMEDVGSSIRQNLQLHDELTKQGKVAAKLKNIKTPTELFNVVSKHEDSRRDLRDGLIKGEDYDVIGENKHWTVYHPKTNKAACSLGRGTNWCTASKLFDNYNRQGPLSIFVPKNPTHRGERYQYHKEAAQFMTEKDEPIYQNEKKSGPSFSTRPSPLHKEHPSNYHHAIVDPKSSEDEQLKAVEHPSMKDSNGNVNISLLTASPNEKIALRMFDHPESAQHLVDAIKHPSEKVALKAMEHPRFHKSTLIYAVQHPSEKVALKALEDPSFSAQHLWHAAKHPSEKVALKAMEHPEVNGYDLWHAVQHPSEKVALKAMEHPRVAGIHVGEALRHSNENVVLKALEHPEVKDSDIDFAIRHPSEKVVLKALEHPSSGRYHFNTALEHPSVNVRKRAKERKSVDRQ